MKEVLRFLFFLNPKVQVLQFIHVGLKLMSENILEVAYYIYVCLYILTHIQTLFCYFGRQIV